MTAGPFVPCMPTRKHATRSEARISALPSVVDRLVRQNAGYTPVRVTVKHSDGTLSASAIPKVTLMKGISGSTTLTRAAYRRLPIVKTARDNASGLVRVNPFIEGNNLTATKARLLLTAGIMRFGMLPPAADPERPTPAN
jgi:L-asparaginase